MDPLFKTALEALVPIMLALIGAVVAKYFQKLGLQVDAQKFFQQREVAQAIVLFIEEQFAASKKSLTTATTGLQSPTGPDKQNAAVTQLLERFPTLTNLEAKNLIDEAVIRLGLGAAVNPRKPEP